MSETANYSLHLTDTETELFQDWRNAMNGPLDSNMIKIDNVLGKKANRSIVVAAVLLASAWIGNKAPFSQELNVEGMTETQNGIISVAQSASAGQRNAARNATLCLIGQSAGKLVVAADGDKPDVNIPVSIVLVD